MALSKGGVCGAARARGDDVPQRGEGFVDVLRLLEALVGCTSLVRALGTCA